MIKIWPSTAREFKRIALEGLIGANVLALASGLSRDPPPHAPAGHVTVYGLDEDQSPYVLPAARYRGLSAIENPEAGTVKFVRSPYDRKPAYDFNFKYNFVVTGEGENLFDKGSSFMPPELDRDFDAVRKGFCSRYAGTTPFCPDHDTDRDSSQHVTAGPAL